MLFVYDIDNLEKKSEQYEKIKSVLLTSLFFFLTGVAIVVPAFAANEGQYIAYSWSNGDVGVTAQAMSGNNDTGSNPKYGAEANKFIKRTRVRLIEGTYDKTAYSTEVNRVPNRQYAIATLSKTNNIFKTSSAYWGWEYY